MNDTAASSTTNATAAAMHSYVGSQEIVAVAMVLGFNGLLFPNMGW